MEFVIYCHTVMPYTWKVCIALQSNIGLFFFQKRDMKFRLKLSMPNSNGIHTIAFFFLHDDSDLLYYVKKEKS